MSADAFARRADLIRAQLRVDVSLAIAVFDSFRGARPWEPQRYYLGERHGEPTGDFWSRRSVTNPDRYIAHAQLRKDGRWDWWHEGKVERWRLPADDSAATAEDAKRRADIGLDEVGVAR